VPNGKIENRSASANANIVTVESTTDNESLSAGAVMVMTS
jgi:hypothetical protein